MKIEKKYLEQITNWFVQHDLNDFQVIYDNEQFFADYLDVETFKFVNSGTSALYLIMKYIDHVYKRNPLVWGPAFCHPSWLNVCEWLELSYDFVDVRMDTLSIDPDELLLKIQKGVSPDVLVLIDMCGYVGEDTIRIRQICIDNDIILVEDAANAFGQSYQGHRASTFGDFGFYSFSNPKLLTVGEGGAIVCNNLDCSSDFETMIYQGGWYRSDKKSRGQGMNFIMANWLTQLLRYQLEDIDHIQREHHTRFTTHHTTHLDNPNPLFEFETDSTYGAPSFTCYFQKGVSKKLIDKFSDRMMCRYKNMASPELYPVSQILEDELIYYI